MSTDISAYLARRQIKTATEMATRLLHEAHVVTVPGEAFGPPSTSASPIR